MLSRDDSSWVACRMIEAVNIIEAEWTRPVILYKPRIFRDGNQWCALYGENVQEGIAGFGSSPAEAALRFDSEWSSKLVIPKEEK